MSHAVDVTAATLYEAVALGLKAIRGHDWVAGLSEEFGTVRVSVTNIPAEHVVKMRDFNAWLQRSAIWMCVAVNLRMRLDEVGGDDSIWGGPLGC